LDSKPDVTTEEKIAERAKVLAERGSFKACFIGCDAHTENDLFTKFTWVKGNLDFNGLRQIIFEPEQRVKIQESEPDLKEDKLIIDQVKFISPDSKFRPEPIKLNRNLNVIIGGKSSGKSILLYNIAKTLLADRAILKDHKYDFGSQFNFEVTIASGHAQDIKRADDTPSILAEIKYIPQNYLSKLAEPESKKGNELLKLVRGLLLEDDEYHAKYQTFVNKLKSNDINRESIINNYFELRSKIGELKKALTLKGDENVLLGNINNNEVKIRKLKEGAGLTEAQIAKYNEHNTALEKVEIEISKIKGDYQKITTFNTETQNLLTELLQRKNLLLSTLEDAEIRKHYTTQYTALDNVLILFNSLSAAIELDEKRNFKQDNIFRQQFYDRAVKSKDLKELLKPFVANQETKKQIEELEKLVTEDKQKLSAIAQVKLEIKNNEEALQTEKAKIFITYQENFNEYKAIILDLAGRTDLLKSDNLNIIGRPCFNFPKLRNKILEISDGRSASYNSYQLFDEKKDATTEYELHDLLKELQELFDAIIRKTYMLNSRIEAKAAIKTLLDDYFFDYWDVIYDNDELDKMSTGKASFVILMLIVGLSKSKAPILIDQPEDNLDNRSITKDLVEYLRSKKLERQIILVTHNANVVVNADAENIIVANQKGQNDKVTTSPYQFDYINGSIEDTKPYNKDESDLLKSMGIREHIAEILEGGKEAFKKRERKYGF
jgi:predicted ATPase